GFSLKCDFHVLVSFCLLFFFSCLSSFSFFSSVAPVLGILPVIIFLYNSTPSFTSPSKILVPSDNIIVLVQFFSISDTLCVTNNIVFPCDLNSSNFLKHFN